MIKLSDEDEVDEMIPPADQTLYDIALQEQVNLYLKKKD